MARQLWLLRHAEAEPHGTREDSERRLTERGEHQARAAGIALARLGAEFDAVLFSPKVRAAQTAELAAEGWDQPSASCRGCTRRWPAASTPRRRSTRSPASAPKARLLLVGHEPDLSLVAGDSPAGAST